MVFMNMSIVLDKGIDTALPSVLSCVDGAQKAWQITVIECNAVRVKQMTVNDKHRYWCYVNQSWYRVRHIGLGLSRFATSVRTLLSQLYSIAFLFLVCVCVTADTYLGQVVLKTAVLPIVSGGVFVILLIGGGIWNWMRSRDEFDTMMNMMVERCVLRKCWRECVAVRPKRTPW
jgi:hypothetical protein